ncbi:alpha-ribazole phosphatase [Spongiimicrobium salis]|uniref:alpha-ribazole phosphatase n=1 Tax=Spongiimicrobium salis TaxID=1667022 RepID=UPI00374CCB7F
MEIYLVRHTTPDIAKGICYGQSDLALVASFPEEYQKIHDQINFDQQTKIYSSPLKRCKKLAATFGNTIQYDARLMELHFGKWEMQAWNAIPPTEINPWMENFVETSVPEGESYLQLQERVIDFFRELQEEKPKKAIVITHAGVIRALVAHLQQIPLKDSFSIQLNYGHVLRLENKGTTFAITEGLVLK